MGIDLAVHKLIDQLKSFFCVRGIDAYLVGGFLRDIYLGRKPEDIDIAVESSGFDAAARLAEELDGHFVLLDDICQIARIVLHGSLIDNTGIKHIDLDNAPNGIMLDLARRDFTVNAMAFPLSLWGDNSDINSLWCHIIDPYQGIDAITSRQIKAVSGQVFKQDPLRLLRGLRLGAQLGFDIEASTLRLMHKQSNLLSCTAEERIRNELLAIFDLQNTSQVIQQLEKTGGVEYLLPELAACKGVQQPLEHHWDVFGHSVNCIDSVDFVLRQGNWQYADNNVLEYIPWPKNIAGYFNSMVTPESSRRQLLKIAALFHDIAKPLTRIINNQGRIRFYDHPAQGDPIAQKVLTRLRFSNREIKTIAGITRHHLRPVQMNQRGELPTDKAVYRYLRDCGDVALDTLYFSLADHLAARGPDLDLAFWKEHCNIVSHIMLKIEQMKNIIKQPRLINGHDLLDNFKLTPGPLIKTILGLIEEAQVMGVVSTQGEALEMAQKIINEAYPPEDTCEKDG